MRDRPSGKVEDAGPKIDRFITYPGRKVQGRFFDFGGILPCIAYDSGTTKTEWLSSRFLRALVVIGPLFRYPKESALQTGPKISLIHALFNNF